MDGILEANFITQLGPVGIGFVALIVCYFLFQRITDHTDVLNARITTLSDDTNREFEADRKAMEDLERQTQQCALEHRGATKAITESNVAFQLRFVESHPSRQEMNDAIDRVTNSVRDLIAPLRDDLSTIRNHVMDIKK